MEPIFSAWNYIRAGGPVMWPLMAVSLAMWSLIVLKALWLLGAKKEAARQSLVQEFMEKEPPARKNTGPFSAALDLFLDSRTGNQTVDSKLLEVAVRHQGPMIWRHLSAITVLAAVAPLLGLLGTVTGMVNTFAAIQAYGTGNAQALAAGISQALITTQTGLLIAIPGLFAAHILRRQSRKIQGALFGMQKMLVRWIGTGELRSCFV